MVLMRTMHQSKVKNYRVEIVCSQDTKQRIEDILSELTPDLRRKLRRRVVGEDFLLLLIQVYQNYNWVFKEQVNGKAQIS